MTSAAASAAALRTTLDVHEQKFVAAFSEFDGIYAVGKVLVEQVVRRRNHIAPADRLHEGDADFYFVRLGAGYRNETSSPKRRSITCAGCKLQDLMNNDLAAP